MPQNQHKIKSEYAKSFKTYKESAQAEYSENMKFRLERRNQEVSHQPWAWLDIDLSEDESDNCISNNVDSMNSESKSSMKQSKKEIRCPTDNSNDTNSNFDASGAVEVPDEESDKKLIQKLKKKALKRAKEITEGKTDNNHSNNNELRRPHHPLKGNGSTFQHKEASSSIKNKMEQKSCKNLASINQDKLFLSYGWGSATSEGNSKKTFNIKSEIDVYPSAIRASKARESIKQIKDKLNNTDNVRPKTANAGRCRSGARTIELDNRAAMDWLSEYQFRFPIYDNEVYKRGLANLAPRGQFARLDTPRTCRI